MSDQLHGPMGWMFVMIGLLCYMVNPGLVWLSGESVTLADCLFPLVYVVPTILIGLYMVTHPYFGWPNYRQDRVERIRLKFDEKRSD